MKSHRLRVIALAGTALLLTACTQFYTTLFGTLSNTYDFGAKTISTFAGTGAIGYTGDGGTATAATLNDPNGLAVDAAGNLYISDQNNCVIRKVDTSGVITTIAGNGTCGSTGSGVAATTAELNHPAGLAIDSSGNLYVADTASSCVREIDTSGTITTFAGQLASGGYSGDNGPATSAQMQTPTGLAFDSAGDLYISDPGDSDVRMVNTSGTITTVAGNQTNGETGDGGPATAAELANPMGIAVDSSGDLFIADQGGNRIRKVDTSGTITTYAGTGVSGSTGNGGAATAAELGNPQWVSVDASGTLFIADQGSNSIRMVSPSGTIDKVVGGNWGSGGDGGPPGAAQLENPSVVIVTGSEEMFISDDNYGTDKVRVVK